MAVHGKGSVGMTYKEILDALDSNRFSDRSRTEAAKAETLYRRATAELRDQKLQHVPRKTNKRYNECFTEAQNEMALKVTEELGNRQKWARLLSGYITVFEHGKHLDDRFYPVAYTVAAVLYEDGVRV